MIPETSSTASNSCFFYGLLQVSDYVGDFLGNIDRANFLKQSIEETGVELYDTRNIQYGIKLMFRTHQLKAEINLFFGHKGYSVVESPKRGTSMQLNVMMAQLVNDYVQTLTYTS